MSHMVTHSHVTVDDDSGANVQCNELMHMRSSRCYFQRRAEVCEKGYTVEIFSSLPLDSYDRIDSTIHLKNALQV